MLDLWETYTIKKPIRLIELFAGYGSQALALERLGVDFTHHQVVEFDKYAVKTYNALHGTNFSTQDITKLDKLNIENTDRYEYIVTYSFPCTDLSIAGSRGGMTKGSGTSSGLLWEVERLLLNSKELPQVLVMENVPAIHGQAFNEQFKLWQDFLTKLGYNNQWQDLNAKHYGVPQNRNRTFLVSVLGDYGYHFPKRIKLTKKLKDVLENNVSENYYLTEKMLNYFTDNKDRNGFIRADRFRPHYDLDTVAYTITTNTGTRPTDNFIVETTEKHKLAKRLAENNEIKPYTIVNHSYTNVNQNQKSKIKDKDYIQSKNGISPTLTTRIDTYGVKTNDLRIRKITPREAFRLMGLKDNEIDKIIDVNSNAQLYKQAGNSIVVDVLEHLFKGLL